MWGLLCPATPRVFLQYSFLAILLWCVFLWRWGGGVVRNHRVHFIELIEILDYNSPQIWKHFSCPDSKCFASSTLFLWDIFRLFFTQTGSTKESRLLFFQLLMRSSHSWGLFLWDKITFYRAISWDLSFNIQIYAKQIQLQENSNLSWRCVWK